MKRVLVIITTVIFALFLSFNVFGESQQKFVIKYGTEQGMLENVKFSLYKIGTVKENNIIPNSFFETYPVSFDISDSEKLNSLSLTLSAYLQRDKIVPDYIDYTDENGIADFNGETFSSGAYLYIGEKHFQYDNIYFCEAAIVVLPYGESDKVVTKPKYEVVPDSMESISISYKVLKAWYADDLRNRPTYIEAQLLRDGEIYDTVILNDENNWRYEWKNLSSRYQWLVTEKIVSDGYNVSLAKNEKTYLLKNSQTDEEKTTLTVLETTKQNETTTKTETTAIKTTEPDNNGDLPQTGALKWPIPYLSCVGMLLFIAGYVVYRKSEMTDEKK